jgi:hypothetical protein
MQHNETATHEIAAIPINTRFRSSGGFSFNQYWSLMRNRYCSTGPNVPLVREAINHAAVEQLRHIGFSPGPIVRIAQRVAGGCATGRTGLRTDRRPGFGQ